jgi:hypothetical protein
VDGVKMLRVGAFAGAGIRPRRRVPEPAPSVWIDWQYAEYKRETWLAI